MSSTVQFTVQPKNVDSDANETDLEQYTITNTYNTVVKYENAMASADKAITLPTEANHLVIELQSDQGITLKITDGSTTTTYLNVKNVIMNMSSGKDYTYTINNDTSGTTANVKWYQYR